MHTQIFNWILQGIMATGLLAILMLLVTPAIKAYFGDGVPNKIQSVLEVNDSVNGKQRLALARAKKLLEQSATPLVEVVAVGKGVTMLVQNSPYNEEILSLMNKGVVFTVCQNSLRQMAGQLSHTLAILDGVRVAQDGHRYAEKLKDDGYVDEFA
jgi:intracellular sulfur oxidation DsrE/DsrF family protein